MLKTIPWGYENVDELFYPKEEGSPTDNNDNDEKFDQNDQFEFKANTFDYLLD